MLRTALLFQDGNFVGREYFAQLVAVGRKPTLIASVGTMPEESKKREVVRTGGLWSPLPIPAEDIHYCFGGVKDGKLADILRAERIDVAIQGGVGILKGHALSAPAMCWLNVHPGRLPQYRGNSCPEWAVLNGDAVYATAHVIDTGIDTGPVIVESRYEAPPGCGYEAFRAALYAHCAKTLILALERLEMVGLDAAAPQPTQGVRYWPAMPQTELAKVKLQLSSTQGA